MTGSTSVPSSRCLCGRERRLVNDRLASHKPRRFTPGVVDLIWKLIDINAGERVVSLFTMPPMRRVLTNCAGRSEGSSQNEWANDLGGLTRHHYIRDGLASYRAEGHTKPSMSASHSYILPSRNRA